MHHSQPLGNHFRSQGDRTGLLVGGNLSPNSHSVTRTDRSPSETDWQTSAYYFLIYKIKNSQHSAISLTQCDVSL